MALPPLQQAIFLQACHDRHLGKLQPQFARAVTAAELQMAWGSPAHMACPSGTYAHIGIAWTACAASTLHVQLVS